MTLLFVYCETCEDWHIISTQGLKPECVIIAGHTVEAGIHNKQPSIEDLKAYIEKMEKRQT